MRSAHGLHNRLIRRLHQHANMTGLFHYNQTKSGGGTRARGGRHASTSDAAGLPITKAFVPVPEFSGETLPPPPDIQGLAPKPTFERSQPTPAQVAPLQPALSSNVFRTPGMEPVTPPTATETDRSPDDARMWNRLQNIFNKHRKNNAGQEATSLAQPSKKVVALPEQPAPEESKVLRPSHEPETLSSNNPGIPVVQTKHESASLTNSRPRLSPSPEMTSSASTEGEMISAEVSSVGAESLPEGEPIAVEDLFPMAPSASVQASETPAVNPHTDHVQNTAREAEQAENSPSSIQQLSEDTPGSQKSDLQSLPLEAVWEVQMTREPKGETVPVPTGNDIDSFSEKEIDQPGTSTMVEPDSMNLEGPDVIREALESVSTAQVSGSGVELIQSRRPRPAPAPIKSKAIDRYASKPTADMPLDGLQRQPNHDPETEIGEADMVPTAIGPLPEDLWKLVDASAPQVLKGASQENSVRSVSSRRADQPTFSDVAPRVASSSTANQTSRVQRQAASPSTPEAGKVTPTSKDESAGERAESELDIEALARQVYRELRHRLSLEWERYHRRS